jgi:hypothetical protein
MTEPSAPPHLQTFTGQFELRDWKHARRIETSSGAIAWELSSALVSCQSAVLTLAVGKPERVLVAGGARRLLTPVEGELRVDTRSFVLKSQFVPEKPDRATGSLEIPKHRRTLGFNLELRRNRLTATLFARTSNDEPVPMQVLLFYRVGEKAPPRRAPEKAPPPITIPKPSTPTPVPPPAPAAQRPTEKLATSGASISGDRQISSYEQRLSGHWVYQEFYSSGRGELHMMLLRNGHCVRTSKSVASLILHDSAGNWAGFMERSSALDAGDRGKWRFDGRLLTLEMDDDSTYEYTVTLSGTSMTTRNTTGGAQRLWTKQR